MRRFLNGVAEYLLYPINPFASMIMGVYTLMWGIWLLLPWNALAVSDTYQYMMDLAPEWAWGSWSIASGFLIIKYGVIQEYLKLTRALKFLVWHWSVVAGMVWAGDWRNPVGITYVAITLYCLYFYFNIKTNRTVSVSDWHVKRTIDSIMHRR